jgi:MEMO1 family protein
MPRIKRSQLAGRWYAAAAAELRVQVDALLEQPAPLSPTGVLAGLVVPHAGYIYSGRAAGAGYICLRNGAYRRAVILAPSHFVGFRGVAVLDADAFETPLGVVPVDRSGLGLLIGRPLVRVDAAPFDGEHALEIQLPLLQRVLPAVSVVPALVGDLTMEDQGVVAEVFRRLVDDTTLFIISSDFVHYGGRFGYLPFPADGAERVRAGLKELDMAAIDQVCAGDAAAFGRYVAETGATICGRLPIAVFLRMHARRSAGHLLRYYTSLDVTGDYEHSVSYASIAFPRPVSREPWSVAGGQ